MTNDNKRFRAPNMMVTEGMIDAGVKLFEFMAAEAEQHTDRALVGGIFTEMWRVYWEEIDEVAKKKRAGSPIVQLHPKAKLILPHGMKAQSDDGPDAA